VGEKKETFSPDNNTYGYERTTDGTLDHGKSTDTEIILSGLELQLLFFMNWIKTRTCNVIFVLSVPLFTLLFLALCFKLRAFFSRKRPPISARTPGHQQPHLLDLFNLY
jgi:hypothetical protein